MKLDNEFSPAANEAEYRRQQQIAALNSSQKARFEKLLEAQKQEAAQLTQQQAKQREDRISQETRKNLLAHRNLAYNPPQNQRQAKLAEAEAKASKTVDQKEHLEKERMEHRYKKAQQQFLDNPHRKSDRQDSFNTASQAKTNLASRDLTKEFNKTAKPQHQVSKTHTR